MAVDPEDFMRWLTKFGEDMMKPYSLALDKLNTEQMALKERLEALEQAPHFQRPNGGR